MALRDRMLMTVELQISCQELTPPDNSPPSHPVVVVKRKDKLGKFCEISRTETRENERNPSFERRVTLDYRFEEVQTFKFVVCNLGDGDSTSCNDDDDDNNENATIGDVDLTLGQIVAARETTVNLNNQNALASPTITIVATEATNIDEIEFTVHGASLDKKDFLGRTDPYLVVRRKTGGEFQTVYTTEKINNSRKPQWTPFSVRIQTLCAGVPDVPISFQVFDHENDGPHYLIGECETSFSRLMADASSPFVLELINQKKKMKKKDYKNSGKLTFVQCKMVKKYSFLDYLFGGCQLGFACGIDFTGSNGDSRISSSLHYMGSVNPNSYVQSIQAIGTVLQDYSNDRIFQALGFGAKIPPNDEVAHDFPLTLDPENPHCTDVQDIVSAYTNAIGKVKLWGPTNLAPIINSVSADAAHFQADHKYCVLLLIIDGVITDMNETQEAIVASSKLPLSIIIVGVGNADFNAMNFLQGSGKLLSSPSGQKSIRDNVRFVLFRNFKMYSTTALSQEVLTDIPQQVIDYFCIKDIPPPSRDLDQDISPLNAVEEDFTK